MGTLADKTMGMVGKVADPFGKFGISDKFDEWGGKAKSKLSDVGKDVGINPDGPKTSSALTTAPNQVQEVSARQRRSSSSLISS